jgi:hypothetical protein
VTERMGPRLPWANALPARVQWWRGVRVPSRGTPQTTPPKLSQVERERDKPSLQPEAEKRDRDL